MAFQLLVRLYRNSRRRYDSIWKEPFHCDIVFLCVQPAEVGTGAYAEVRLGVFYLRIQVGNSCGEFLSHVKCSFAVKSGVHENGEPVDIPPRKIDTVNAVENGIEPIVHSMLCFNI